MLVLSRRENESIELPELGIVVRVLGLKKTKVHLGIDAPPKITVMRSEKLDRPAKLVNYFRPLDSPSRQLETELTRLESQFAALAELADTRDRSLAQEVAADAIARLAKLKRRTAELARASRPLGRVADVVAVRAEVIDQLRGPDAVDAQPSAEVSTEPAESAFCVRQSQAEYAVPQPRLKNPGPLSSRVPSRRRECAVA